MLAALWAAVALSGASEGGEATPSPRPSAQLAYLAPTDGPADIYLYDAATGESQRLTEVEGVSSFSANGDQLYFSATNEVGGTDIWRLDLASGEANLLYACGESACDELSAAPDGTRLAFERREAAAAGPEIWLLNLQTNGAERTSPAGQIALTPQWGQTAEGDLVLSYYDQDASAYVVADSDGNEIERYRNATGRPLAWETGATSFVAAEQYPISTDILRGPGGDAVFQTPEPGSLAPVVVTGSRLMHYNATGSRALFADGEELIEDATAAFSPDGARMAFTRKYLDEERWTPGRQLWLLDVASGDLRQLTEDADFQVTALAWAPDSHRIAYTRSNQTDFGQPAELWLLDEETGEAVMVALNAYAPAWVQVR